MVEAAAQHGGTVVVAVAVGFNGGVGVGVCVSMVDDGEAVGWERGEGRAM